MTERHTGAVSFNSTLWQFPCMIFSQVAADDHDGTAGGSSVVVRLMITYCRIWCGRKHFTWHIVVNALNSLCHLTEEKRQKLVTDSAPAWQHLAHLLQGPAK